MATSKQVKVEITVVVTRSFGNFTEGERITTEKDEWTTRHLEAGLLKEVKGAGEGTDQAREG